MPFPDQKELLQYASLYEKKSFDSRVHTCQALHGVVVGISRDECRCQMSDQSNLATACDRAEEKIWVGYLLLNPSFILTYAEEGIFLVWQQLH